VKELEKFGDDVDSEENNEYNYDDNSHLEHHEDPLLSQLRSEYDDTLDPESYQQTNSSSNTHTQYTLVPGPTQSLYTEIPPLSQFSSTPSTQLTQYRRFTPSSNEPHQFHTERAINPPSATYYTAPPSNTPSYTQALPPHDDIDRNTPSTTDTTHPDRNTPFIPITRQELERRRNIPSITLPLQQHNTRLLNERLSTNKNYPPLNLNAKSTNKPTTRQSKPSSLNQLASSSSSSSSSSSTTKPKSLIDSDSEDGDIFAQHTALRKKAVLRRRK
jgi:hypothetical protein